MTDRGRWAIAASVLIVTLAVVIWFATSDSSLLKWLMRLYEDKHLLKETVRS